MALRVPFRVGRVFVSVGLAASAATLALYAYKRYVLLDPFKVVKDDSGAYRWQSRLEHINERLEATLAALRAAPTDTRLAYEAAVWLMAKQEEEARLRGEGKLDDAITDDDLNA